MAVRHGYGKIAGADALVFAYDTGDTRNSYKGEPTVNLADTDSKRTLANYGGGTTSYADAPEKGPGWKKVTITAINGSNHRLAKFPYITQPTNTTRTYSLELDFNGTSGYYVRGDGFTGLAPNIYTSGKHSWTFTTTTNSGVLALFLNNGSAAVTGLNDVIYYRYYQVEDNAHATQFTAGTRSATQGLLDLTGNNTIDLSNTGFDSNAQPVFDGTNDHMDVGTGILSGTGDFTVEAVIQSDYQTVNGTIFANYPSGNFQTFFSGRYIGLFLANSSAYLGTAPFTVVLPEFTTDPIHFLALREGTETRVYLNGELKKTGSSSSTIGSTSATFRVGANTSGTEDFLGSIFVVKAYNRALTAAEVKNNFNQYKTRFGI